MMRYDVCHNVRVSPLGGRRPSSPEAASPPLAEIRIDAVGAAQLCALTPALQEAGARLQVHGATLFATLSGSRVAAVVSRWQAGAGTHQFGVELATAWQPLPGVILLSGGKLEYRCRALVMGIINTTPDSFYPPSRRCVAAAAEAAARMAEQGADLVDLGGESTRPGAAPVPAAEEIRRVVPAVEAVVAAGGPPVSIDTAKAEVAAAALDAGAAMVNDVSGLRDLRLRRLVAERDVPAVVMHMRGSPRTMQQRIHYEDTVGEVLGELKRRLNDALDAGVRHRQLIVDPGIGFGKRVGDNLRLLQGCPRCGRSARCSWGCRASRSSASCSAPRWRTVWTPPRRPTPSPCCAAPTSCGSTTWPPPPRRRAWWPRWKRRPARSRRAVVRQAVDRRRQARDGGPRQCRMVNER